MEFAPDFSGSRRCHLVCALEHHKTAHRGQQRRLLIGPQAQEILLPLLEGKGPDDWLFSPQEAVALQNAEKRKNRKTKVQPSQFDRRKARGRTRLPGPHYTVGSYSRAVTYAIAKANTAAACDACKRLKPAERCAACCAAAIPHWHPYQLRHNAATRLVQQFGWDIARMVLGHRQISMTRVYALDDVKKAADAVAKVG